jgi:MYXO-CTERM domain-containing protein
MRSIIGLLTLTLLAWSLTGSGARAQQAGSIRIMAPTNGATVAAPVNLTVAITGVTVKPASAGDPDAFHYHIFIDVDPATVVQPGQPIPTGRADIIHTADLAVPLTDLAPGPHTVWVVLTRTDHVPLSPSVQDRVQFTVAGAGQAAPSGAPRVGTGVATGAGAPGLPVWLILAGVVGGAWLIRRRMV